MGTGGMAGDGGSGGASLDHDASTETGGGSGAGDAGAGAAGSAASGGATGTGGTGGTGAEADAGGTGGTTVDSGTIADAAGDARPTKDAEPGCPDVNGSYKIIDMVGTCGNLNDDAPQSIASTVTSCIAHFVSEAPAGVAGINGAVELDAQGNFTGAKLYEGPVQRSRCSGYWDAEEETMTIVCGGEGDACKVVIARTGPPQ